MAKPSLFPFSSGIVGENALEDHIKILREGVHGYVIYLVYALITVSCRSVLLRACVRGPQSVCACLLLKQKFCFDFVL